jgi:hypothetical protein
MNPEQREAEQAAKCRALAKELDVEFELLLGDTPSNTICLITAPICMAETLQARFSDLTETI